MQITSEAERTRLGGESVRVVEVNHRESALMASLFEIWAMSVRATHDFLSHEDFEAISGQVPGLLKTVPRMLVVLHRNGEPSGFAGIDGDSLEMLFVRPGDMGCGVGKRLVTDAVTKYGVRRVSVNEQNRYAVGFYKYMGFHICSRQETDDQGRPYPLLHMKMDPLMVENLLTASS